MLKIRDVEYFEKVQEFAKENGLDKKLQETLSYLDGYAGRDRTVCELSRDFAPQSFRFAMYQNKEGKDPAYWFNGAVIFHGPHDGGGSGGAPTYSVCVSSEDEKPHWQVHT